MLLPPFELSKKCQSSRHHLSDLLSMMSGKSKALKPMVEKLGWRFMSIFLTLPGCSPTAVSQCSVIGQVQKNLRPTGHFIDIYFHWKRAKRRKRWSRPEHHQICMYLYILFNGQVGQYTIFDVLFVVSWKYFGRSKRWSRHKPPLRNSFLISLWEAFILGLLLGKCIIPLYWVPDSSTIFTRRNNV